jgi:anaerobic selenocysteine-containing dehydrogenase
LRFLALLAAVQVADVFEQLATTVADSTQASIAQLMTQQQEVSGTSWAHAETGLHLLTGAWVDGS